MTLLCALAVAWSADDPFDLPSIGDLSVQEHAEGPHLIGVEAFALLTTFDSGFKMEDTAGGLGADLNFRWKPRGKVSFGFSLGFLGYNTENDEDRLPAASVRIRQYRAGFGVEFPARFMEFGLASTVGITRYRSDFDDDSSPYCELEGNLGFVPAGGFVKVGLLGVTSYTQSSFNHTRTHLYHNYSAGVFVEIRF